jgi:hypothetical protein
MESIQKKRPVDTLTYENHEEWFFLFKEWTKGEGIDFVLRKSVEDYAKNVTPFNGFGSGITPESSNTSTASGIVRSIEVQDLLDGLGIQEEQPLQGSWNLPRLEKYAKAESKIRYTITICVDDIDSKLLKEHQFVRNGWDALSAKYLKIRLATAREHQIRLTNYQWEESQTIDNAWIEIKNLRRKVVAANPQFASTYDESALLQFLLPALPDDYSTTVATLNAQPNLTVQDKLVALRNYEDVLRTTKVEQAKALKAKESTVPYTESIGSTKCKFCNIGRIHSTDECEFRKAFNEVMNGFVRKQIRRARSTGQRQKSNEKGKHKSFSSKNDSTDSKDKKSGPYDSLENTNKVIKRMKIILRIILITPLLILTLLTMN